MSDRRLTFHGEQVEQARPCPCGKEVCRPRQRDGQACHAKAQGRYRDRLKAKRQANDAAYIRLMTERAKTQEPRP